MDKDGKKEYLEKEDSSIFKIRLDSYSLPSLIPKVMKTMKKNGITEITTTRIEKLHSNFVNEEIGLDQFKSFKEGDTVVFRITLLDCTYPSYFYRLLV